MTQSSAGRGEIWFSLLTGDATPLDGLPASVKVADGELAGQPVRWLAVVPDAHSRWPRARRGEVGLQEGWTLAQAVREAVEQDASRTVKRGLIAIIDVPGQAYGRREEALGIHQSLAGAVAAWATARLNGHPVVGLIVGKAMSGAFLALGYQANRLIAFNDPGVMIHAMGKAAAARITLRTVAALEALAARVPPMAYDIGSYQSLGLLDALLTVADPLHPTAAEQATVQHTLAAALAESRRQGAGLGHRLQADNRRCSREVREKMRAVWRD
ncbi:biotin-independent malonate decarboxylase subunit gamma [Pantoea sp. 1.19]|uniref:biotin-independent malonate decarboxylase subunit gamma n=1 Tax=Pantoea sp. 1.19 TaxID=1925589 RepID=UPI000948D119|nr:biotin-independent malonate decarboxylase subunit gamma [Pantoea sp. 1.19]